MKGGNQYVYLNDTFSNGVGKTKTGVYNQIMNANGKEVKLSGIKLNVSSFSTLASSLLSVSTFPVNDCAFDFVINADETIRGEIINRLNVAIAKNDTVTISES